MRQAFLAARLAGAFLAGALRAGAFLAGAFFATVFLATVLSSPYPGGTILLAWGLLKERITHVQWMGIAISLVAIALIAV